MIEFYLQLSRESVDLMFKNESPAMLTDPLTVEDMAHEIAFVKSAGANIPNIDKIDPSIIILKSDSHLTGAMAALSGAAVPARRVRPCCTNRTLT